MRTRFTGSVRLLQDGSSAFPAMLAAIRAAKRVVLLETYIYGSDTIGERFARALAERAASGVEVDLLLDGYGTWALSPQIEEMLVESGVRLVWYHPVRFSWRIWEWRRWGQRNHRKQLIVDGNRGFLGGINIHDEELPREEGGGGWRDTQLELLGHPVVEMVRLFAVAWRSQKGPRLNHEVDPLEDAARVLRPIGWRAAWNKLRRRLRGRHPGRMPHGHVEVVGNATHADRSRIRRAYLDALRGATRRIRITNPYFVPDLRIQAALRAAARRGVSVEILVAGPSDVGAVRHAGRALYGRLLSAGVRIYELQNRVLHAKTAVMDSTWCTVGSFNLDRQSWRYMLEANAVVVDPALGKVIDTQFESDLSASREIALPMWSKRGLAQRFVEWFFWLFRSWL